MCLTAARKADTTEYRADILYLAAGNKMCVCLAHVYFVLGRVLLNLFRKPEGERGINQLNFGEWLAHCAKKKITFNVCLLTDARLYDYVNRINREGIF